jgi:UPF0271 protein
MNRTTPIDLNADVGESFGRWRLGDDAALVPHLTSANVACGFHAGDARTLWQTVQTCVAHDVAIGAQVGYADLVGFGRRAIDMPADDLTADVLYQLGALDGLARAAGGTVTYLKPHGALYHRSLLDPAQAQAIIDALLAWPVPLAVMTMGDGVLARLAANSGFAVITEGFADRAYDQGRLVPRDQPGAVLTGDEVVAQALRLAGDASIHSLCIHGDTPGASQHAAAIRAAFAAAGIDVRAPGR